MKLIYFYCFCGLDNINIKKITKKNQSIQNLCIKNVINFIITNTRCMFHYTVQHYEEMTDEHLENIKQFL